MTARQVQKIIGEGGWFKVMLKTGEIIVAEWGAYNSWVRGHFILVPIVASWEINFDPREVSSIDPPEKARVK